MGPHLILLGMVFAQLADAATFVVALARLGIENEANGIAAALYEFGGLDAVLVAKGIAIVIAIWILVVAGRSSAEPVVAKRHRRAPMMSE